MVQNEKVKVDYEEDSNCNVDCETKAAKVEVGDNYAIVAKESEEGDPFYIVMCNQPVYKFPTRFRNGWNNKFFGKGDGFGWALV
jgi:hypothetical protein